MKIHEFSKNALEKVVIEISEYQGKEYLNIQVWFDASKGQNTDWRPSPRGITLSIDLLQEFKKGIDKAVKSTDSDKERSKEQSDKEWINEKAKWIYDNSICLDSRPHKIRHPITVKASMDFIRQLLQDVKMKGGR